MKRDLTKKGSFTVELSILLPFLIIVILIFFYFIIFMYNRGVMQNAVCRGAKQIFYYMNEDNETIEDACTKAIFKDLEGSLVAVKDTEVVVQVSATEVTVMLKGELEVPQLLMLEALPEKLWQYQLEWSEPRLNVAEMLRSGQQIEGVFEKIQEGEGNEEWM